MIPWLIGWAAVAATTMALDLLWLGVAAKGLYQRHLGHLMADSVYWPAAAVFYCLYGAGVLFFCVAPALETGSLAIALRRGALLGLLVYGTYDLTNLALLRGWGGFISVVDIAWGVFLTAAASGAGTLAARQPWGPR